MTHRDMEQRLAGALHKTAPDDVNGVLSHCEARKGTVLTMTKTRTKRRWTGLAAACLAVLLLGGGALYGQQAGAVASVVSLDVNPSIELRVNRSGRVLSCTALNDKARTVLADMDGGADLKRIKLDVAVNAIVGSLVKNGYLTRISSAIMISVEDKDVARAEQLQRELTRTVDSVLQASASQAAVLSQTVARDTALEEQARENHISTGKAALIRQVQALNGSLAFDSLAALSVEELRDLAEAGAPALPIGTDRALEIARAEFAARLSGQPAGWEVDAELDEAPARYEVELKAQNGAELEVNVDAYTGAVLGCVWEEEKHSPRPAEPQPSGPSAAGDVGYAGAKAAALAHAGVSERTAYDMEIEPDYEAGRMVYEVEFKAGGMEYDYVIDAVTGAVLEHEAEPDD